MRDLLPTIETPVQIIAGARDHVVPPVNAEYLHERLPKSKLDLLDTGHFTWEDGADQYAALVTSWWAGGYSGEGHEYACCMVMPPSPIWRRTRPGGGVPVRLLRRESYLRMLKHVASWMRLPDPCAPLRSSLRPYRYSPPTQARCSRNQYCRLTAT